MRKWYKYYLDSSQIGNKYFGIDSSFKQHAKSMLNYCADDAYKDKQNFFKKYFFNYQCRRLEYYDNFLRKHLHKEENILSVGSGRCANELFLMEDGYKITCSDLEVINAYPKTKNIFPNLNFIMLDILQKPAPKNFDTIIALSLIYLFDDNNLELFFKNVSASLKKGGCLLLDSAGSPDNMLSYLIHDVWLKYETLFLRLIKFMLTGKCAAFVRKHHGYHRTDDEIIELAKKSGLKFLTQENSAFIAEFRRSRIFNKIVRYNSTLEKIVTKVIGKNVPYIRMYKFIKVS